MVERSDQAARCGAARKSMRKLWDLFTLFGANCGLLLVLERVNEWNQSLCLSISLSIYLSDKMSQHSRSRASSTHSSRIGIGSFANLHTIDEYSKTGTYEIDTEATDRGRAIEYFRFLGLVT